MLDSFIGARLSVDQFIHSLTLHVHMSAIQKNPPPQEEAPKLKRGADLKIIFLGEASVG
jgi:hypothetical protein